MQAVRELLAQPRRGLETIGSSQRPFPGDSNVPLAIVGGVLLLIGVGERTRAWGGEAERHDRQTTRPLAQRGQLPPARRGAARGAPRAMLQTPTVCINVCTTVCIVCRRKADSLVDYLAAEAIAMPVRSQPR